MSPPTATATRPEPVLLTISRRPPAETATGALPIPIDAEPIADNTFVVIGNLDEHSQATMCNCSASDDNPY